MPKTFYAASLTKTSPDMAIEALWTFDSVSLRNKWVNEHEFSVRLLSSLYRKVNKFHISLPITLRTANRNGWVEMWFYNDIPEWLM